MDHLVKTVLAAGELELMHSSMQCSKISCVISVSRHYIDMLFCHKSDRLTWHWAFAGWKSTLQVLTVAVADPAPSVVDAALDAIQAVTAALFRGVGIGMEYFPDVVHVLESAMRNPYHERLSVSAAHVMPSVARRLADAPTTVCSPSPFYAGCLPHI